MLVSKQLQFLKILKNLVFMQTSLTANNCWYRHNFKLNFNVNFPRFLPIMYGSTSDIKFASFDQTRGEFWPARPNKILFRLILKGYMKKLKVKKSRVSTKSLQRCYFFFFLFFFVNVFSIFFFTSLITNS